MRAPFTDLEPAPPRARLSVVSLLVVLGLLAALALVSAPALLRRAPWLASTPHISQDIAVERVRSVAKLLSSETTLRDVVVYRNTWLGSTKRSLVVVTGRVLAGIDLERGARVHVDDQAKRIRITLPRAQILAVEIVGYRTYDERGGLWNPFRPTDRDTIHQLVRQQLERTATELGVVEHADQSARTILESLFAADGYTVSVDFSSPPVIEKRG